MIFDSYPGRVVDVRRVRDRMSCQVPLDGSLLIVGQSEVVTESTTRIYALFARIFGFPYKLAMTELSSTDHSDIRTCSREVGVEDCAVAGVITYEEISLGSRYYLIYSALPACKQYPWPPASPLSPEPYRVVTPMRPNLAYSLH
jgi:hypothetical protein